MSAGLMKMWISLAAIAFMFISVVLIMLSRHWIKFKPIKIVFAFLAYILMILSGIIIFIVVFSGPVSE